MVSCTGTPKDVMHTAMTEVLTRITSVHDPKEEGNY
jgi:hypothetical protein